MKKSRKALGVKSGSNYHEERAARTTFSWQQYIYMLLTERAIKRREMVEYEYSCVCADYPNGSGITDIKSYCAEWASDWRCAGVFHLYNEVFLNNICTSLHEFKWNFVHCRAQCFPKHRSGGSKIAAAVKRDKSEVVVLSPEKIVKREEDSGWMGSSGSSNYQKKISRWHRYQHVQGAAVRR